MKKIAALILALSALTLAACDEDAAAWEPVRCDTPQTLEWNRLDLADDHGLYVESFEDRSVTTLDMDPEAVTVRAFVTEDPCEGVEHCEIIDQADSAGHYVYYTLDSDAVQVTDDGRTRVVCTSVVTSTTTLYRGGQAPYTAPPVAETRIDLRQAEVLTTGNR